MFVRTQILYLLGEAQVFPTSSILSPVTVTVDLEADFQKATKRGKWDAEACCSADPGDSDQFLFLDQFHY